MTIIVKTVNSKPIIAQVVSMAGTSIHKLGNVQKKHVNFLAKVVQAFQLFVILVFKAILMPILHVYNVIHRQHTAKNAKILLIIVLPVKIIIS